MSWVRVAWSKCTLLYVSYMLVQISFFISSTYIVFVFIDPKISTPMNQGRVPHNNLSFHICIPPSYHNFIKWRPSTLDPVPRPGRPRNFVTMCLICYVLIFCTFGITAVWLSDIKLFTLFFTLLYFTYMQFPSFQLLLSAMLAMYLHMNIMIILA